MNKEIIKFFNDFFEQRYSEEMRLKYLKKLPPTSIKETVNYLIKNNLAEKLFHKNNDSQNRQGYLLLKIGNNYQIVLSERGNKHRRRNYFFFKSALFDYVDAIFNGYGMTAPDSKIGKVTFIEKIINFIVKHRT